MFLNIKKCFTENKCCSCVISLAA
uniref:Uncharacterized protein n=1 Tax=Anguilla anguilla TaxID=7936 RepID=A0A0E9U180_ANGAN